MKKILLILGTALILMSPEAGAQQTLTLDDCRQMAVRSSRDLEQARTAIEMAGYDKKIALANYFPNLSATGTYQYNSRNISLVSDSQSAALQGLGDRAQGILDQAWSETAAQLGESAQAARAQLEQTIRDNPLLALEYTLSPMWKTVFGMLSEADLNSLKAPQIAEPVNAIGKELDEALHLDNKNLYAGVISLQQPLFVGGKIIYSNQMAALAEELEEARYDQAYADILVDVDEAYWQIVSIAGKKKLAEAYADLLHTLESDVQKSVEAGVMTEADALQIKVKANEADLLRTKAGNGLTLAKMLLCKRVGLPLDNQVTLVREGTDQELLGWIRPFRFNQFSADRSYFSWLLPKKRYAMDTNLHGGPRAFLMNDGYYARVLPMDIYPVYLAKACLAGEIEKMERFGIYEVLPEDLATCEFVDPSKNNIQAMIEQGIDLMLKEMA